MMLGWSGSEVMGRDAVNTVIPEVLRTAYREGMRNLRAPGSVGRVDQPTDAIAVRRDGTELPVEATAWIVNGQLTTLMRDASTHKSTPSGPWRTAGSVRRRRRAEIGDPGQDEP